MAAHDTKISAPEDVHEVVKAAMLSNEISGAREHITDFVWRMAIERAAEEGRLAVYQEANREHRTKTLRLKREPSCVDYGRAVHAAIRSLTTPSKGE